jgi:hypothetical protein
MFDLLTTRREPGRPSYPRRYLSPTSIKKWDECPARWGLNYLVLNNREPPTPQLLFGTAVHAVLEQRQRHGIPPDTETREGRLAQEALMYLPPPKTTNPETEFRFAYDGIVFGGKRDDWYWDENFNLILVDYKTSSNPERWGLRGSALLQDTGAVLYGIGTLLEHSGSYELFLQWLYLATTGAPRAKAFPLQLAEWSQLVQVFEERILPSARQIWAAYENDGIEAVRNAEACHNYGRICPYLLNGQCDPYKENWSMADTRSRLAAAQARKQPDATGPGTLANGMTAEQLERILAGVPQEHQAAVLAGLGLTSAPEAPEAPPTPSAATEAPPATSTAPELPAQTAQVNPPEQALNAEPERKPRGRPKKDASTPVPSAPVQNEIPAAESLISLGLEPGQSVEFRVVISRIS